LAAGKDCAKENSWDNLFVYRKHVLVPVVENSQRRGWACWLD
jgi:hypothetical protein